MDADDIMAAGDCHAAAPSIARLAGLAEGIRVVYARHPAWNSRRDTRMAASELATMRIRETPEDCQWLD